MTRALGNSVFNYREYSEERFLHYYQQLYHVLKLNPSKVLEAGPGDHTITDMLRRKGVYVKTIDNDGDLYPDYRSDIRKKLPIQEKFDVVLASEILEHANIRYLERTLSNLHEVLNDGGRLVISLPYSTIRLFPKNARYGKIISCEGRLRTYLPFSFLQPVLTIARGVRRVLQRATGIEKAFEFYRIPEYPDDRFDVHHWDLGYWPTTRSRVRQILERSFAVIEEKAYVRTNCVFFTLGKRRG